MAVFEIESKFISVQFFYTPCILDGIAYSQNLATYLTLSSTFSPVRVQMFSAILRKESFPKVKNKSDLLSEEKI
jgi:hypothetical protein